MRNYFFTLSFRYSHQVFKVLKELFIFIHTQYNPFLLPLSFIIYFG